MGRKRPAHGWTARRARNVVLGLVLSAAMASAAALPALVSSSMTDRDVAALLDAWAGPGVTWQGEPQISVFPTLQITLRGVTVLDPAVPGIVRASMPAVEISFKTLPLLFGRIEPDTVSLVGPDIRLPAEPPDPASDADGASPFGALLLADANAAPDVIVLSDGVIHYTLPHTGGVRTLRTADLRLAWDRETRAAALTGRLIADGREFAVDAELHHPWQLFSAAGAPGRLRLDSASADEDAPFEVTGTFRLSSADSPGGGPGTAPPAPIDTLEISEASFQVAGVVGRGTVAVTSTGARPTIAGSLAFRQVDLGSQLRSWLPDTLAELLALPLDPAWLRLADIDLEVSADTLDFGSARFDDAAARLTMQEGRLGLSDARAEFAGGEVEGSLTLADAGSAVRVRAVGALRDVSLGEISAQLERPRSSTLIAADQPPRGEATASFELHSTGASVGAVVRSVAGRAAATVSDGSVDGADAVATLERVVDGGAGIAEGQAPFIPIAGRTHFNELSAELSAGRGTARVERMRLVGDRFEISVAGELDLSDGALFANGSARLFDEDGAALLVELPFGVGGTLLEPMGAPGIPRRPDPGSRTAQHRPLPATAPEQPAPGDPDVG